MSFFCFVIELFVLLARDFSAKVLFYDEKSLAKQLNNVKNKIFGKKVGKSGGKWGIFCTFVGDYCK